MLFKITKLCKNNGGSTLADRKSQRGSTIEGQAFYLAIFNKGGLSRFPSFS